MYKFLGVLKWFTAVLGIFTSALSVNMLSDTSAITVRGILPEILLVVISALLLFFAAIIFWITTNFGVEVIDLKKGTIQFRRRFNERLGVRVLVENGFSKKCAISIVRRVDQRLSNAYSFIILSKEIIVPIRGFERLYRVHHGELYFQITHPYVWIFVPCEQNNREKT